MSSVTVPAVPAVISGVVVQRLAADASTPPILSPAKRIEHPHRLS
jgi:hypothetical protein